MTQPEVLFHEKPDGRTRAEMIIDGECVSWLSIVPFTIRVGAAEVRMDGIGGVGTAEKHRMKGYSRRVFEATVEHMARGDAAISMLYGIRNFYEKFGYATAGPAHHIFLTDLSLSTELPAGWNVRPFVIGDFPAVRDIYCSTTSRGTGAAVRSEGGYTWSQLTDPGDAPEQSACRVIVALNQVQGDGDVHGYVWLAHWCHTISQTLSRKCPDAFIVGEAAADGPASADAVLAVCRQWAREWSSEHEVTQVLLPVPPDTHVAAAAMRQDARFIRDFAATGGSMVRVLDVKRLLESLRPEIRTRLRAACSTFAGRLTIRTDIGDAALVIQQDDVDVENVSEERRGPVVEMPQTALGRLALGGYPPEDILARLPEPPDETTAELLKTIFPMRHPHMYVADRF